VGLQHYTTTGLLAYALVGGEVASMLMRCRGLLERRLRDRITTIMLTNGGDTDRLGISTRIQRILRAG
jgi:hypothetical protein